MDPEKKRPAAVRRKSPDLSPLAAIRVAPAGEFIYDTPQQEELLADGGLLSMILGRNLKKGPVPRLPGLAWSPPYEGGDTGEVMIASFLMDFASMKSELK